MGRKKQGHLKLTCRITPDAMGKLAKEASKIESGKPPYGEMISRLILEYPDTGWKEFRDQRSRDS